MKQLGDMLMKEITYRIYADESVSNGKYYSNFYGGALVKTTDIPKNYVCAKCLCI